MVPFCRIDQASLLYSDGFRTKDHISSGLTRQPVYSVGPASQSVGIWAWPDRLRLFWGWAGLVVGKRLPRKNDGLTSNGGGGA